MQGSLRCWVTHGVWAIIGVDSCTIEEKSNRGGCLSLALAKGVHELREVGGTLDFEENLVVVVCDLDIQMLTLGLVVGIAAGTRRLIVVRHGECWSCSVLGSERW